MMLIKQKSETDVKPNAPPGGMKTTCEDLVILEQMELGPSDVADVNVLTLKVDRSLMNLQRLS